MARKMEPLKVLSIDWDYFINATASQRASDFPDGGTERFGVNVSSVVWKARYAWCPNLSKIGIDKADYQSLINYLNLLINRRPEGVIPRVAIVDSHMFIYEHVRSYLPKRRTKKGRPVKLFNIDYHPDDYNIIGHSMINCGNWVNHLLDVNPDSNITWLGRGDSDSAFNTSSMFTPVTKNKPLEEMLEEYFEGELPDLIFLCRSSVWSPPHLDGYFDNLARTICKLVGVELNNTRSPFTRYAPKNRWTDEYVGEINRLSEVYNDLEDNDT